jgi:hypothetical protein
MTTIYTIEFGSPYIKKRTESGWTTNFVFNKNGLDWVSGSVFYYWGISGETIDKNYADNNLSFSFSEDGEIVWKSIRYEPKSTITGTTNLYYTTSGSTPILCENGTSNDFNITITFKRNAVLEGCDIVNNGGLNDLISDTIVSGSFLDWITGATLNETSIEVLNPKWYNERNYRLGTLRFYLNGNPIYKLENWEEIVPSQRDSENPLVQAWGIGTSGVGNIHSGLTQFDLKNIKYIEEPLNPIEVKNYYNNTIKKLYTISECEEPCLELPSIYQPNAILLADGNYLITSDRTIIIK